MSLFPVRQSRSSIVCLCGSTRFKQDFIDLNFQLTMAGFIVLSVGFFGHDPDQAYVPTPQEKIALDALHKEKIDLADIVLIIDRGGYIGDSTRGEINHAILKGRPVVFASNPYGVLPLLPLG